VLGHRVARRGEERLVAGRRTDGHRPRTARADDAEGVRRHAAGGDAARHADLARARVPVRVLSQATSGTLERYRTVLEPMGIRHELRAALRSGGRTWGFLRLFRPRDPATSTPRRPRSSSGWRRSRGELVAHLMGDAG